jgi:hypothetical protein
MPYVRKEERENLRSYTQGQLCFQITRLAQEYFNRLGESFATYGEIRNAIMSAWDVHFYPKLLVYEKKKRDENGDVT